MSLALKWLYLLACLGAAAFCGSSWYVAATDGKPGDAALYAVCLVSNVFWATAAAYWVGTHSDGAA